MLSPSQQIVLVVPHRFLLWDGGICNSQVHKARYLRSEPALDNMTSKGRFAFYSSPPAPRRCSKGRAAALPGLLLFHPAAHPFPSARGSTATRLPRADRGPQTEEDRRDGGAEQTGRKDSSAQRKRELQVPGSSGWARGWGLLSSPDVKTKRGCPLRLLKERGGGSGLGEPCPGRSLREVSAESRGRRGAGGSGAGRALPGAARVRPGMLHRSGHPARDRLRQLHGRGTAVTRAPSQMIVTH